MARNTENLNLPFANIFPRFSYRWIYDDGEESPYAPWSEVGFAPSTQDDATQFLEGENSSMCNAVTSIVVQEIPRGGPDVVAIQVVYTESISSTVYELDTINIAEENRGSGNEFLFVEERILGSALPPDQLLRSFDNVPRRAKAQDMTANRLIYANYLQNYNQPPSITMNLSTADADSALSVKSSRSYQVGVAYIDQFGRQGGLIEGHESGVSTDFTYAIGQRLTAQITSAAPEWATHYRYFIKDTSGVHHNLVANSIFNDGGVEETNSQFVWLHFNSSERNKITDDTVLIPRRTLIGAPDGLTYQDESRHSVLEIQDTVPDAVNRSSIDREIEEVIRIRDLQYRVGSDVPGPAGRPSYSVGDTDILFSSRADTASTDFNTIGFRNAINGYLESQNIDPIGGTAETDGGRDVSDTDSPLLFRFGTTGNYVRITNVSWGVPVSAGNNNSVIRLQLGQQYDEEGLLITGANAATGLPVAIPATSGNDNTPDLFFTQSRITEVAAERLRTGFFVRVPRSRPSVSHTALPTGETTYELTAAATTENIPNCFSYTLAVAGTIGGTFSYTSELGATVFAVVPPRSSTVVRATSTPVLTNPSANTTPTITQGAACTRLVSAVSEGDLNLTWFETIPTVDESLDIFWEDSGTFPISEHGDVNNIDWYNCVVSAIDTAGTETNGIYIESINLFDRFNSVRINKGVRANAPQANYAEERRFDGLIWSGIHNSRTEVNRLNQFIQANGITKEVEANYGGIQKIHTRDTNLIVFCEDKIFRILADKDQLTNVDGTSGNITAANVVLGQTTPFIGEFGISRNPESFASYGNNIYFTDASRGSVMQLTPGNGQLFEISNRGMADFFRDRFAAANDDFRAVGSFNEYKNSYILTLKNYNPDDTVIGESIDSFTDLGEQTVAYDLDSERWPSRFSFTQEAGTSLGNRFYTWSNGRIWLHNSSAVPRNNFYGVQSETTWDIIVNADTPSVVKNFVTLGYEGDEGWELTELSTEEGSTSVLEFVEKEGKYHGAISGTEPIFSLIGADTLPAQTGDVVSNGYRFRNTGQTQRTSGIKGLFATVRVMNDSEAEREIHAINSSYFDSSF